YFLRKLTAAVLAGILAGSSAYVPAYAAKNSQSESAEENDRVEPGDVPAERPDNETISEMVYDCLYVLEEMGEDPSDYTLMPATIYSYEEPEWQTVYWFLLKKGTIVDMTIYDNYISPKKEGNSFPDLDDAIAHQKPIALVIYLGGFYLVEKDRATLIDFVFYAKDHNPEEPIPVEELDFSVYRERLATVEMIRLGEYWLGEYPCERGKVWEIGKKETPAKKLGFRFYRVGWNEFDGEQYYLKKDDTLATGTLTIGGIRYKFDQDGVCQGKCTGFTKSDKGRRFWKNGKLVKNKWIRVNGERKYYAGEDGYLVTGDSPKISVEFPDGAVYESADGGKSWTKDGEVQTPSVYVKFEGEYPVRLSEGAVIAVGNEASPFLYAGDDRLFREENGEWTNAELLDKEMVFGALAYVIEENKERRFPISTSLYVPLEGKYLYTMKLNDPERNEYQITVEFRAVEE
ncbi:MAG: hypothetical protein K2N29_01040, partial [Ruminiclostridium sp.]|nr:hypothetical protein [Ruminiclostridium sp.]